ncbi:MAG: thioredoxin domain-containing protein, partial [Candidatus Limnocylindria bacterium]
MTQRRRRANHLAEQTSPYLLQHALNPVDWYPWGPEALERARREDRPIFLSIGYAACHWCHVMERESFENEAIAEQLNRDFVAIKVDREERPDLDDVYMAAVQAMTGSGGWPMNVFLTPGLEPFYGGTYFPPEDRHGMPGLPRVLAGVADAYRERREDVLAQGRMLAAHLRDQLGVPAGAIEPEARILEAATVRLRQQFDPVHGGFGPAPKFPAPMTLEFLLRSWRRSHDPETLRMVTVTLDRMADGGIHDQLAGGFARYSTDARWLVPHFEKMLYDNALLATVYLQAYETTQNPYNRRIGTETLDFALRDLRDPGTRAAGGGGFWGTLDADSGGGEGRFYLWTPAQVIAVLGKADGELFNRIYGITPEGNFDGTSIPNLLAKPVTACASDLHTTPAALWARLDGMRAKLRATRAKRPRPRVDDKVLANWNGLMLSALAEGYQSTGDERYRQAAEQTAEFLLATMRPGGKLVHSYRRGRTEPHVFLDDYSDLIAGLLDLHEATGAPRWLTEARSLANSMVAIFWDDRDGMF